MFDYLRLTGRTPEHIQLVEAYYKAQGLFRTENSPIPAYTQTVDFALDEIEPSLAGPKRPQDRVALSQVSENFLQP